MSNQLHVIFGSGPVGCWIARSLRTMGKNVRAVNRSGRRPALMPDDVEILAADVLNQRQAVRAADGAAVVYQALNPPYHRWAELFPALQSGVVAAAKSCGARYVSIENLYMYDPAGTINEQSPVKPQSGKGMLRAAMAERIMALHKSGEIQVTALRASDYYGPGVLQSVMGERVFANLAAGKKAQIIGNADVPHSWAYIEDVGAAAAILGTREDSWGRVWIVPHAAAKTQREMVDTAGQYLGISPKLTVITPRLMRLAGLFNPQARASVEMMYQFMHSFIVDGSQIQQAFQLKPTTIETGIARTADWFRERLAAQ